MGAPGRPKQTGLWPGLWQPARGGQESHDTLTPKPWPPARDAAEPATRDRPPRHCSASVWAVGTHRWPGLACSQGSAALKPEENVTNARDCSGGMPGAVSRDSVDEGPLGTRQVPTRCLRGGNR